MEYPYLPKGRNIKYISIKNRFMGEAERVMKNDSTDGHHSAGAVIVMNGEIIGRGGNQSAFKNKTLINLHKNGLCIRRKLNIPSGKKYWLCPGCASSKHHAESRAVRDAIKNSGSIDGADLYLYGHWWCCESCWNSMIKAGIRDVYLVDNATELFNKNKSMISPFMLNKKRPPFIVLEGGEGSGKSTLLSALKNELGDAIVTTREPGGSPYAEVIRTAALKNPLAKDAPTETTLCLMFAARFDNTVNLIAPALKSGKPVIADRFDASSYAYNAHAQSGGALEKVFWQLRERLEIKPDLYIFIDVAPKEGIRRASSRNQSLLQGKQYDHFDDRELDFHAKVREGYLKFFKQVPHVIIDANRSIEEVKKDFMALIKSKI